MAAHADLEHVRECEIALLTGEVRRDRARLLGMLHPEFVEIGRSGRVWTRDDVIDALTAETDRAVAAPQTDEWSFHKPRPDLVLVTYRIVRTEASSRHSSLWDLGGDQPLLRFHQGTVVP